MTRPPSIALERSTINGGVHLTGNRGPIAVAANTIAGGLFCSNNAFDLDDEGIAEHNHRRNNVANYR